MRRLLFVLAFPFLLLATSAQSADDKWMKFKDPNGVFAVRVPEQPTTSTDSVTNTDGAKIPMLEYTVDKGDHAMMVIVSDMTRYPDADATKVLDGAVNGVKKTAASVTVERSDSIDGQSGRFLVVIDANKNQITDRVFFVHGKLYQVMYVLPVNGPEPMEAMGSRFLDSFHFTVN